LCAILTAYAPHALAYRESSNPHPATHCIPSPRLPSRSRHRDLKRSGVTVEAEDLLNLREKILALVPRSKVARLETDHEALLEAQGLAARPGPRQRIDRKIAACGSDGPVTVLA
jgi:hypothetical protein